MGFDFTVIVPLLPSHFGFSFVFWCGVSFGGFQCLPVNDCPAASCDSGVITRGSESTAFYSAILVQGPHTGIQLLIEILFNIFYFCKVGCLGVYCLISTYFCTNILHFSTLSTMDCFNLVNFNFRNAVP